MDARTIVILGGDQTGQELLEAALRVLQPDVIGLELSLPQFDLSLESRRATANGVVHEAAHPLDHEVAPREVVGGVGDVAERGPQVLAGGVQLFPGGPQRPLVDRDRPHGDLLPR